MMMNHGQASVLALCLAVLAPCAADAQAPAPASGSNVQATVRDIRLGPGDVVRMEVKDEPGLSGQWSISPDGMVLFPLVGMLAVAGRPISEVRAELVAGFGRELAEPVIRITPLVRIPVLGEVRVPGLQLVDPTQTIGDVIATAGGLTPFANRKKISLLRGGQVLVSSVEPNAAMPEIMLESGDQIVVARRGWVSENAPILIGALTSVLAAAATSLIVR